MTPVRPRAGLAAADPLDHDVLHASTGSTSEREPELQMVSVDEVDEERLDVPGILGSDVGDVDQGELGDPPLPRRSGPP